MAEDSTPASIDITEGARATDVASPVSKAVAVEYDREKEKAPQVVASGRGAIAEQIINVAFEHGVKVREDADLVEILELVDVDSPIPLEAFTAVAEILAYVYMANNQQRAT